MFYLQRDHVIVSMDFHTEGRFANITYFVQDGLPNGIKIGKIMFLIKMGVSKD